MFLTVTFLIIMFQKWKLMSCQVKIQQLKEAVAWANEELKNGEFFCIF